MQLADLIDPRTMILTGAFASLALGLALAVLARTFSGHVAGVGSWALACVLGGVGSILIGLRTIVPDFASFVLGVGGVLLAHALQYDGVRRFVGLPPREALVLGTGLAGVAALAVAWAVGDTFYVRIAAFTVLGGAFLALAAWTLLAPARAERLPFAPLTGRALALCAVVALGRGAGMLAAGPAPAGGLSSSPLALAFVAVYVPATIVATVGFTLMVQDRLRAEMARLATLDPLTGVFNRRAFIDLAERELARGEREGAPASVLMLDVDHFKSINDRFGHAAGDAVLRGFAQATRDCLRRADILARYGGEEFCVLLPGTALEEALAVAERIRRAVADAPVEHGGQRVAYSISAGLADTPTCGRDLDRLLTFADRALYAAKDAGRDRVCTPREARSPLAEALAPRPTGA